MSDIFREIDEELRRDSLQQLWTRYGKYVIGLAVVVVIATAAVMGWREYKYRQYQEQGARFGAALDLARQGKNADAADAFTALAQNADRGRASLARLEAAASKAASGEADGAIAIYDQLAGDNSADQVFRDMATLLAARYALDKGDPATVVARLQPLTNAANPWHGLAVELTALAELKSGDKAKARADFDGLAKDNTVTQGVRQRAAGMVQVLGP